ncbi:MAG: hypothetical protein NC548_41100 [Lachnospiraceae bacterium]|nr:hypothetical protein [Lachnospiraceae bacterium]
MPRGVKKEVVYTGKAAKINERVLKLEADVKAAKEELKVAYKEQLKEEKQANQKAKKEQTAQILKLIEQSGKSPEEIMELLKNS